MAELSSLPNHDLSPYTGWTREHWVEVTQKIIAGALQYADRERGWFNLPASSVDHQVSEHHRGYVDKEFFERSLIAAALYAAGVGRRTVPGWDGDIIEFYLRGIIRGTDPNDECYWGPNEPYGEFGTTIAVAMLIYPEGLWDPLTPRQKEMFCRWAEHILHLPCYDNNHWYFRLGLAALFRRVGWPFDEAFMTSRFERCLQWHRGDGWFVDGNNRAFDHYNFWGFALYNTFLCWADRRWRQRFGDRIEELTRRLLSLMPMLFGRDGGPVAWGRSLAYRFAGLGAIAWAHLVGMNPLSPGQARRLTSGALKFFWEGGCLNDRGLLSPGWTCENPALVENYIAIGAPYWTCHGLAPLMIPAEDEFWVTREEAIPADEAVDRVAALPAAAMVLRLFGRTGEVRLHVAGTPRHDSGCWQVGTKYYQHSYSSVAGFAVAGEGRDLPAGRAGASLDGKKWVYRHRPRPLIVSENHIAGYWSLHGLGMTDARVVTHTLLGPTGEVHIVYHTADRPLYLFVGGYAVATDPSGKVKRRRLANGVAVTGDAAVSAMQVLAGPEGRVSVNRVEPTSSGRHSHLFGGVGVWPGWTSEVPVEPFRPVIVYTQTGPRGQRIIRAARIRRVDEGAWLIRWGRMRWRLIVRDRAVEVSSDGT